MLESVSRWREQEEDMLQPAHLQPTAQATFIVRPSLNASHSTDM